MFKVAFTAQVSPELQLWTEDQCYMLHLASLEMLERTGVVVQDTEALKLLKDAGCTIKDNLVRFPASVIKWAVNSAPERCVLATTDGKRTVNLEHNAVNFGMGGGAPLFFDSRNRCVRDSRLADVEDAAKVANQMENIGIVGPLASALDTDAELADLYQFKATRTYTTKPYISSFRNADVMKAAIEMGIVSSGNLDNFKRNPNLLVYIESCSPLTLSQKTIEQLLLAAEYGVPVVYVSQIVPGSTGQADLFNSLAQANADCLAGLAIHQLKQNGAPFVMGIIAEPKDKKSQNHVIGDPAVSLSQVCSGILGRYYKIPSFGVSGCTDACMLDVQAAMEATFSITAAALGGINLAGWNGCMGNRKIGSLENLIMANEIIGMTKHFMRGVEVSEETIPIDLIDEVGPGGQFLTTDHTMKHFRTETWYPRYMNRQHYKNWLKEDGKDMRQKMNDKVLAILLGDNRGGVTEKELDEMDSIIQEQAGLLNKCKDQ